MLRRKWQKALVVLGAWALICAGAFVTLTPEWASILGHIGQAILVSAGALIVLLPRNDHGVERDDHGVVAERHFNDLRAADQRANELLLSHLSPIQREQYEKFKFFVVRASDGSLWRITHAINYNARRLNDTLDLDRGYCAYPPGVPLSDRLLAQKLLIETDVEAFQRVAYESASLCQVTHPKEMLCAV